MKAAGTHSAHLSKWEATASASPVRERPRERAELAAWEAMIKAEKFEAFAKAELGHMQIQRKCPAASALQVRRLARAQRFRPDDQSPGARQISAVLVGDFPGISESA